MSGVESYFTGDAKQCYSPDPQALPLFGVDSRFSLLAKLVANGTAAK